MTTADDLKSALGAWVDETESNISDLRSGLGSIDAAVATLKPAVSTAQSDIDALKSGVAALQAEVATEQSDIASIKSDVKALQDAVTALQQPVVVPPPVTVPPPPPPPIIADPSKTFVILQPGKTVPDGVAGSAAKLITVDDTYGVILCWQMNAPTHGVVDDTHSFYSDGHATGQKFIYNNAATVKFVGNPLNPTGTPAPTGGSTPPPPTATQVPTGPVVLPISMPPTGTVLDIATMSMVITPADTSVAPITLSGANSTIYKDRQVFHSKAHQRRARAVSPDGRWQAWFYIEADNSSLEFKLQYGDANTPSPDTFKAYTVEMFAAGHSLGSIPVPYNYWTSLIRARTSERPDVQTCDQIVASKLVPAYAPTIITPEVPILAPEYTPMGHSNEEPYEGETGGRGDLKLLPAVSSALMAYPSSAALRRSNRIWAEVANTLPCHIYGTDGRMFDFSKNQGASTFRPTTYTPPLYIMLNEPTLGPDGKALYPNFPRLDYAHHPNLSFLEFLLTGDPHHAEELMHQTNFFIGGEHADGGAQHTLLQKTYGQKTFIIDSGQERGAAWELRLMACCYIVSMMVDDEVLLPTSFWKMVLDRNRDVLIQYCVNNPEPRCSVFGMGPGTGACSSWQEDFLSIVLGWMETTGLFPDWQPIFDWRVRSIKGRVDPTSGKNLNTPFWYYSGTALTSVKLGSNNQGTLTIIGPHMYGWTVAESPMRMEGDYVLTMIDDTTYNVLCPDGKTYMTGGALNKPFGSTDAGKDHLFGITNVTGSPKAGDTATITVTAMNSWADLDAIGDIKEADKWNGNDYVGDLLAALTLFAQKRPELVPMRQALLDKCAVKGGVCGWQDSFALAA